MADAPCNGAAGEGTAHTASESDSLASHVDETRVVAGSTGRMGDDKDEGTLAELESIQGVLASDADLSQEALVTHLERISALLLPDTTREDIRRMLCERALPDAIVRRAQQAMPRNVKVDTAACVALSTIFEPNIIFLRAYGRSHGVLKYATAVMRNHYTVPDTIAAACRLARELIRQDDPPDQALLVAEALLAETTLELMREYPANTAVLTDVAWTLCHYTANELAPTTMAFLRCTESLELFIGTMNRHRHVGGIATNVCGILSHISSAKDPDGLERMSAAGIIDAILAVMRGYPDGAFAQTCGITCLAYQAKMEPNRAVMIVGGVVPLVMKALALHPGEENLSEYGCLLISELAQEHTKTLMEAEVLIALVDVLQDHIDHPDVVHRACVAVKNLAADRDASRAFVQAGFVGIMQNLLLVHVKSDMVAPQALMVLSRLSRFEENRGIMNAAGTASSAIQIMRAQPTVRRTQESGANILSRLTSDDQVGILVFKEGATDILLTALKQFLGERRLTEDCCVTLCFMAYHGPHAQALCDAGVIGTFVEIMKTYSGCVDAQSYACDGLKFLARASVDIAAAMVQQGAVDVVYETLQRSTEPGVVFTTAVGAMGRFCRAGEGKRRFHQLVAAEPILRALLGPVDINAVREAAFTLRMAFDDHVLAQMR